jgi:acyl-CoA synthetase (NDP forming)
MNRKTAQGTAMEALLRPRCVAIVGASDNIQKIGGRPLHYLLNHGYRGRIFPVSQRGGPVQGIVSYPSLDALPEAPDSVILSVPADAALAQVEACARIGARNAILFSSGFGEMGTEGLRQQQELVAAARAGGMRLLGPNTIGAANFSCGAILSFASVYQDFAPQDGPVAIVSQSGAVGASAYALLRQNGVGVRYVCTTGNQADIEVCDFMGAVLADPSVRLLLLYLEEARDLGALESALALARSRGVPVLVLQAARSDSGAQMAACHTGAAGTRGPQLARLLSHYGCRRVASLPQLTAGAPLYLTDSAPAGLGMQVGVISNSGASCVLAADACDSLELPLAGLAGSTVAELEAMLPAFSRSRNPVDLTAMLLTDASLLGRAVDTVLRDPGCTALALSLLAMAGAGYDVPRFAADTGQAVRACGKPAVFSSPDPRVRSAFAAEGIAVFASEHEAIAALKEHCVHREAIVQPA